MKASFSLNPGKKSSKEKTVTSLEEHLVASEVRYRRLFETAKDGILILDAETGTIMDVNPFLYNLLGYGKEKLIEKEIWEIGFFKDIAANKEKFLELQQKEYVRYDNLPLETADGRKINVEFVSNVYLVNKKRVIQCNIRDITERKKSEKALIISETLLRTLVQTIPDLVWLKNTEGIYLSCNPMFERFFGAVEADIIGKTDYDFVDRKIADSFRENDMKAMKAGKPIINEELITFADDGHQVYLETIKAPMVDSQNNIIGVLGIGRDITDRKKAQDALRASEEKYRAFFETSLDAILLTSPDGSTLAANPSACSLLGYSEDEIIVLGKKGIADDSDSRLAKLLEEMKLNGKAFGEITLIRKDGTHIPVEISSAIFKDHEGTERSSMIIRDITARKNAEKDIAILSHSLKSINECVSITDLDNKILFVNESFLKTYGYTDDELIGKNISIVRSQNNMTDHVDNILPATILGEWKGELVNMRKDGREFPVHLSTSVIRDKDDNVLGLIGVATDISESKLAEKELIKAKEKAEESDRLKSAFLANMSHEIRTPMNGILGFTELLKEPRLTGDERHEYISIIEKSGARMLGIINDIINISRIEAGQMEIMLSDTNINEQFEYILNFFKPEADHRNLKLLCKKILQGNEAIIRTDKEKFLAVLVNLVNNAIKFTENGSVELGYDRKGSYVEFYVKDTGIGIPEEIRETIFDRFRQGSESLIRNYEGAGLGLAISRAYVNMLGGTIWVENSQNDKAISGMPVAGGSKFCFTIPYIPAGIAIINIPEDEPVKENIDQLSNLKILVAEDDKISAILISRLVKNISRETLLTGTGSEAVEACRNNPDIDIILMDIKMPGMDGCEATRQIREFNKKVIIIAQTAYGLNGDRDRAIASGCNDYISKPVNPALLMEIIKRNIGKVRKRRY